MSNGEDMIDNLKMWLEIVRIYWMTEVSIECS